MARDAQRQEAEQRYITGDMGLRALGQAMSIPASTINRWSTEGKWAQKRRKYREKTLKKAVNRAGNKKAGQLARMLEATGSLENALIQAAQIFEQEMGALKEGKLTAGQFAARNLESLAKAMNATAQTRMLISGIMSAAEKEKLAQQKRQLDMRAEESAGGAAEIQVEMEKDAEEISK